MSSDFVLLTGATGGTGAMILEKLLEAGYSVNAVLRSFAKGKAGLSAQYKQAVEDGRLLFTEVPDMAAQNAFHDAAKGASAIIHAATPISNSDFDEQMVKPVLVHLDNILYAAAASGTVKRVVITGSIVSYMRLPQGMLSGKTFSEKDWNDITREEAVDLRSAYQYSKVSSEQRAWAYMEREKPSFDLVYLLAPMIIGRSIQVGFKPEKDALGGNGNVYGALFDRDELQPLVPYYMDTEDVAAIHVRALDISRVPGNKRYPMRAPGLLTAEGAANKIREALPELRDRVPAGKVLEQSQGQKKLAEIDSSTFDSVFGSQWLGWEGAVIAIAKDILAYEQSVKSGKST